MFLSAVILALVVGVLAGGGFPRLAELRLRWLPLLGIALALRLGVYLLRPDVAQVPVGWVFVVAYLFIFAWLWRNWNVPGLQIASVGIAANTLAVVLNGGQMPVWGGAFSAAGFSPDSIAGDPFHHLLLSDSVSAFVARGGLFGDVIPIPIPLIRDVVSLGDILLALGIFWAIVYAMTRPGAYRRVALVFGGATSRPAFVTSGAFGSGIPYALPSPPAERPERRARGPSPYLQLARNRQFSLLWVGQAVSLFGDRVHYVALAFLVTTRGTPLELGITFAATAIPNVVLGPLAGALVDRWDRRRTMIACDLLRAVIVLTVPFAIEINILLVYLAAFAIATVTLLFRPAKAAVVPQVVGEGDLVTANSAISVAETAADLFGLPLAAVIVASLSGIIEAAFLLDGATYLVSAIFIGLMVVPRQEETLTPFSVRAIWSEMVEGWNFLHRQAELFANTVITTLAQIAFGAEIVLAILYAEKVLDTSRIPYPQNYGLLLAAVGLGSVVGGVALGWIGDRLPKGPLTIAGLVGMGLCLIGIGFVRDPYVAIGLFFLTGATNMLFLIPTITLFQQRTPQRLMGRVVSSRQALVFGVMAASMAVSGWLAGIIGPAPVLVMGGAICALAGLSGLALPAMRQAR
jgi:DHA3 family macrolide efflux protein-like MFS transporter